jgi:tRNA(Ile)-lysidine synthase
MMVGMELVERFRAFVGRYPALAGAGRVGVAVSGGGDSVALAVLARDCLSDLVLLHVNYGLRGVDSEMDEALVRELGAKLRCEVLVQRMQPEGRGEEELRQLRYEWFSSCPVDAVLTGHTREDQAETVLFRMIRGSGLSGLVGVMPVVEERVYRPLLEVGRGELREWLSKAGFGWREDLSNLDTGYRRNWIRHELLPLLRSELNPEVERALAQLAAIARDEEAWVGGLVEERLAEMVAREGEGWMLDCDAFCKEALGLRRRLMRRLLERVKGNLLEIEFGHVEAALGLSEEREGNGRIQVPGLDLMRSFGWMRVIRLEVLRNMPERNFRVDLPVPGEVVVPEGAGKLATTLETGCNYNECGGSLDWDRLFAAQSAERRLELRNWRPGDCMVRDGGTEPEKVKELFQKYRIPLWRRRAWPIVVLGDLPVWVGGFGPTAEYAPQPETRTVLHIEWIPAGEA